MTVFNGIKVDRLVPRISTITTWVPPPSCTKKDKERKSHLFASLVGCALADPDRLTVKDCNYVQAGYFYLVDDDEVAT